MRQQKNVLPNVFKLATDQHSKHQKFFMVRMLFPLHCLLLLTQFCLVCYSIHLEPLPTPVAAKSAVQTFSLPCNSSRNVHKHFGKHLHNHVVLYYGGSFSQEQITIDQPNNTFMVPWQCC